jgi:site-specific DNA-cytosine methylase
MIDLFAGLGGLALAAPRGFVLVAAYDQDHAAASAHEANHGVTVVRRDLAVVDDDELGRWGADAWFLSPPCQPFTRRGRGRDVDDPRCRGLLRVIELLLAWRPRRFLLENVPGFHGSRAHARLVAVLASLGHDIADVEACPSELGAPVRRRRHFVVSSSDGLAPLPAARRTLPADLADYLDAEPDLSLAVPRDVRQRTADHLSMAGPDGLVGTFTRSYGRAITGAGPVAWTPTGPRYFSPEEILRLHGFPPTFQFPETLDRRTRWRLAGNSVHVPCVRRVAAMLAS